MSVGRGTPEQVGGYERTADRDLRKENICGVIFSFSRRLNRERAGSSDSGPSAVAMVPP